MTEEKKDEKQEAQVSPKAQENVKPAEPKQEAVPAAEAKVEAPKEAAAQSAKPAETEKKAEVKKEKPANCAGCNKSIKKKRWYYRDGKYYCTKRCWMAASKKKEAKPEAQEGAAA